MSHYLSVWLSVPIVCLSVFMSVMSVRLSVRNICLSVTSLCLFVMSVCQYVCSNILSPYDYVKDLTLKVEHMFGFCPPAVLHSLTNQRCTQLRDNAVPYKRDN